MELWFPVLFELSDPKSVVQWLGRTLAVRAVSARMTMTFGLQRTDLTAEGGKAIHLRLPGLAVHCAALVSPSG